MTNQTRELAASLPRLAELIREADGRGHRWQVVRWEGVPPSEITLDKVRPLHDLPVFSSRTEALLTSWHEIRDRYPKSRRTSKGHQHVLRVTDGDRTFYQTV